MPSGFILQDGPDHEPVLWYKDFNYQVTNQRYKHRMHARIHIAEPT